MDQQLEQTQALEDTTDLDALIANHTTTDINTIVVKKILAAMDFGRNLIAEYGASNVLAGLTISQIQSIMTATAAVQSALSTGSLYVAISEINNIVPDGTIITTEKLTEVRNKIEDFLGIPRT